MTPQILLANLRSLLKSKPPLEGRGNYTEEQFSWLGQAKAAISEWNSAESAPFNEAVDNLIKNSDRRGNHGVVVAFIHNVIARVENALPQKEGQAFGPGAAYDFFKALNDLIATAKTEILVVDPYLDAEIFDGYLDKVPDGVSVRLLLNKNAQNVQVAAKKFQIQFPSKLEMRRSSDIHDRAIFVDQTECWVLGASIKDAAVKKPTYLAPLASDVASDKLKHYEAIWASSTRI